MQDAAAVASAWRSPRKSLPAISFRLDAPDGGNTPNKRGLKLSIRFAAALLFDAVGITGAAADLLDFLEEQEAVGHCCQRGGAIETGSGTHGQLHVAWAALALWALLSGRRSVSGPWYDRLYPVLQRWWWSETRLAELCRLPPSETRQGQGGQWWTPYAIMPGWRAWESAKAKSKGDPPVLSNACRDVCARLIFGEPAPPAGKSLWQDRYYLGALLLRELEPAEVQALRPPSDWTPPLPYPLHVRRFQDGHVAWYDVPDGLREQNQPALLAGFRGGKILWGEAPLAADHETAVRVDLPALKESFARAEG
jgi:hypothetical protein